MGPLRLTAGRVGPETVARERTGAAGPVGTPMLEGAVVAVARGEAAVRLAETAGWRDMDLRLGTAARPAAREGMPAVRLAETMGWRDMELWLGTAARPAAREGMPAGLAPALVATAGSEPDMVV